MAVYICQLPAHVQEEIRRDAYKILIACAVRWDSTEELNEAVENLMCEKLTNVLGSDCGLLDYDKYKQWL